MKILDKNNSIKIETEDLDDAKLSAMDYANEGSRKRAFINVLAARLAIKMFFSKKLEANNAYSLYTIHKILEELDIADIYLNGIKIDVRLVFNREEIFIPKTHFDYGMLPDLYLVLELKKDFTSADPLGFFEPKDLNKENQNKDYYFYEYEKLNDIDNIKTFLKSFTGQNPPEITSDNFAQAAELFLPYTDAGLPPTEKQFLFKQLKDSPALREKFVEFENFEIISKVTVKDADILNDSVLDIVGAQSVFEEEKLSFQESKAEIIDEVLSDLLDEEIGESLSKPKKETDNEFSFEDELSFEEELENEAISPTKSKTDNNILGDSAKIIATGLGVGGVIAAGSMAAAAGAAEAQAGIAKSAADAISSGLDLAGNIVENMPISDRTVSKDIEKSALDNLANQMDLAPVDGQEDLLSELPDLDLGDLREEDFQPEAKTEEISNEDDFDISGFNFDAVDDESEITAQESFSNSELSFDEIRKQQEQMEEFKELDELEKKLGVEDMPFNVLDDEDDLTSTISINEDTAEDFSVGLDSDANDNKYMIIDDDEPLSTIDTAEALLEETSKLTESAKNLTEENSISKIEESDDDEEIMKRIRESEAEEEDEETEIQTKNQQAPQDDSDDFNFEVDDFLKNIEISDEDANLFDDAMNLLDENIEGSSEFTQNSPSPSEPDNLEASGDPTLKMLFEGENKEEVPDLDDKEILPSIKKDKKMVIAASIASVVLVSLVVGGSMIHNKNKAITIPTNIGVQQVTAEGQAPVGLTSSQTEATDAETAQQGIGPDLNAPEQQSVAGAAPQAVSGRDMGQAVSDAFSSEPVNTNITKVAWEVPEDLAYNDGFRTYLQIAGKNLKINLQNNLLLATEMAYSNKVIVDLSVTKDGALQALKIVHSSGSKEIDKIVLQSVKETMMYLKMPASELSGNSATATLIINF